MLIPSSQGPAIKQLQRNLNARLDQLDMLIHISVQVNGIFDSDTLLAVKYLQSVGGLSVDGRINEPTKRFVEQGTSALDVLKIGSRGNQVRAVQRTLIAHDIEIVADGHFGEFTELGVKRYQQGLNLIDDGVVAAQTWRNIVRSRLRSVPCIALLPNPYSIAQLASSEKTATNGKL